MLAISLPVDTVLVVKEHPWMVGKRSLSAYKKILNIPRVKFADPRMEARTLVKDAELVAVITSSVALEAALLGKPVLTFGDCPFNILPSNMVRRCDDPRKLNCILQDLLTGYRNNEDAIYAYIAAVFETSVSINLYSVLLAKKNVHIERGSEYVEEISKLATHVRQIFVKPYPINSTHPALAEW
jgi:CDP-glycerol glycerophosphotransferase (TagB/SpsB family)